MKIMIENWVASIESLRGTAVRCSPAISEVVNKSIMVGNIQWVFTFENLQEENEFQKTLLARAFAHDFGNINNRGKKKKNSPHPLKHWVSNPES
ncbi:hypothetical protein TNCV_4656821 [Trichonephila clavipes]|nr:hypothetical protein TNCV_4656821 [Trichonephila clavipes]